jgi:DNA-binding response OmpR family regulator
MSLLLSLSNPATVVVTSPGGEDALRKIREGSFDLYIFDRLMPGTSGIDLCDEVRRNDAVTPVLFYSACGAAADRIAAMRSGANGYLVKPNDLEVFAATVESLLTANRAPAADLSLETSLQPGP